MCDVIFELNDLLLAGIGTIYSMFPFIVFGNPANRIVSYSVFLFEKNVDSLDRKVLEKDSLT